MIPMRNYIESKGLEVKFKDPKIFDKIDIV